MGRGIGVIIPAAGSGKRLGGLSKPLIEIGGRPIILRLLELFAELGDVKRICIAVQPENISDFRKIVEPMELWGFMEIVEGGTERPSSVKNAFQNLKKSISEDDLVCIHDAARPLLSKTDLDRVIEAGWKHGAAFLAAKVKDTLKVVDESNFCVSTIDRSKIFAAQTPQVMTSKLLSRAYDAVSDFSDVTDEIMLLERIGVKAFVVEPHNLNLKLTTAEDLELLKKLIF
ncbi:MAG: 2-C-methyl-D-erythritol 4-phosphate cytidylyltransferase [Bacteroidetes bacterium]|nr:2-C-methyl-D-erythritol 4-phosphate cytidylyltransferase [Bacteroidota bacterium]